MRKIMRQSAGNEPATFMATDIKLVDKYTFKETLFPSSHSLPFFVYQTTRTFLYNRLKKIVKQKLKKLLEHLCTPICDQGINRFLFVCSGLATVQTHLLKQTHTSSSS